LRRARESLGLSVQKAADDLRLDVWIVEALEADAYDRAVPSVYAKGHLKKYSQLLGIAPDAALAGRESGSTAAPAPPPRQSAPALRLALHAKKLPWLAIGATVAIALILILLWWRPWKHRVAPQAATAQVSAPAVDAGSTRAANAAATPVPADVKTDAGAALGADAATNTAAGGAGRARLRVTFSANSWLDVRDVSGRRVFVGRGRANTVKTLAGAAPLRVYLGFARGVQLEVNERAVPIAPTFMKGEVARFLVGADGVLRPYSSSAVPSG